MIELPDVLPLVGLEGIQLKSGAHEQRGTDSVCAMEAVSWLAGEKHSDHPQCACPVIGAFIRTWNDGLPSDEDRARWLRPLLPLILNTRSTKAVELTRSYLALDWLTREQAPAWLSLTDSLKAHAVALRGLAPLTDMKSCRAAQAILDAAWAAAWPAPWDAARDAARAAAGAAAGAAARGAAWAAARDAARAAAWAAAGAAARGAAWAAARDAAGAAARDAAWDAARDAARAAARAAARDAAWAAAWDAARDAAGAAAWDAAGAAARDALQPTVVLLQASTVELVKKMIAVKA